MKNFIAIVIVVLFTVEGQAQKKLTLEDAVRKPRTTLAPEKIKSLQWIKDSESWSYVANNVLKRGTVEGIDQTIIELDDLNKNLGLDSLALKNIPSITWLDDDRFIFYHDNKLKQYQLSAKKATVLLAYNKEAKHKALDKNNFNLAYTIDNNIEIATKTDTIRITDDKEETVINGQAVHRFEFGINKGLFWSPKGNYLAFYNKDESMVDDYPLFDISAVPAPANIIKYPMAGTKSHHVKLGVYDLDKMKTIWLETGEPKEQYLTNVCWAPDEKHIYIAVVNRDQNHMKLNQYDVKTGKFVKTLFEEKDDQYVEPMQAMYFLASKADEFLWFSERDGFDHLYHYNTSGKLIKQLTKGKWKALKILGFDEGSGKLLIRGTGEVPIQKHIYSVVLSSGKIKQLTKEKGTHSAKLSSNGKYLINEYSSTEVPRLIRVINNEAKEVKQLLEARDPLADYRIGKMEIYTIKAVDGTPLYCRLIKPSDFDPKKKYPVIVYVYGGPHAQMVVNSWGGGSRMWMFEAAERGYLVFTLDNRGSYNRGIEFEQTVFRQLGTLEMMDQLEGVAHLKSLPYVDSDRMAVHGWSYGG
ncbi:MAG: DPP IV N-terminal domain-containing protein, partial [Bacteroidetes bacterium]|nr:DPP IV N-terminal domain-containing protein [Bacteroidota bacterium]